jgi:PAS domain S-box-containing protein
MGPERSASGRENDGLFRAIFTQAAVGIAQTGLNGDWLLVNDRLCEILGYTQSELRTKTFLDITYPEDRDASQNAVRQLLSGETASWFTEKRYLRKCGTIIWGRLFVSLVRDSNDQPQYFIAVLEEITDRIQSERALEEKQHQLRLALGMGLGVWDYDLRGGTAALSPQYRKVFGSSPMSSGEWMKLIHPDDRDRVVAVAREGVERTHEWEAEFRVLWPDGGIRWMLSKAVVILDDYRRPARMVGISLDVTERKRDQEQRSRLAAIVESTDIAIVSETVDGTVMSWNRGAEKLYGYSAEEMIGKNVSLLFPPDRLHLIAPFLHRLSRGERIENLKTKRVRKDGREITVHLTLSPIRDNSNAVIGASAISFDITDRDQAEVALRESEERFRKVFEDGPIGLALVGSNYRFLKVNRALCQMVGYAEAELLQMSFADITYPDDLQSDVDLAEQLFRGELPVYRMQKRYVKKNGDIIWINLTASVIRDHEGSPLYGLGMMEDVTEMKRTQEEAFARQKLESIGLLAGGIAHDFNNLLGGILAEAELATMEIEANESALESIQRIRTVASRGAEIVRELMIYSGQDSADPIERIDFSKLVQEMLELLKVSISKQVALHIDLDRNLPSLIGRASQLRQIVMNLIINASEAIGDKGGTIRVTTSRVARLEQMPPNQTPPQQIPIGGPRLTSGEYLKLEVTDTGAGMTEDVQAKIFDPFFSTKFTGRGLGLAVVQRIVQDYDGAIKIVSAPGQGATFEIFFPIPAASSVLGPKPTVRVPACETRTLRRTALVVEDEDALRFAISKLLHKNGFDVIEAPDGSYALELLRERNDIDVMLLDLTLPGASSRDVFNEAQRIRPDLKVVVTSAYGRETVDSFFDGARIERFIRKPFEFADLIGLLQNALSG